jgi:hypothetical protein
MPSIVNRNIGLTRSFRCCNIRIGGWNSFSLRNSIWPTQLIPVQNVEGAAHLCNSFRKAISGYILFNDEDDGFRISWLATFGMMHRPAKYLHRPCKIRPSRQDIISLPEEKVWETNVSYSATGQMQPDSSTWDGSHLEVAFEAYLSIDALLRDILDKRKHSSMFRKSPYQSDCVRFMPEFCYNLVSVTADRMEITLVLVFSNKEKHLHTMKKVPLAMGVFVRINLYDQSYDELQWVCDNSTRSLKSWCASLVLNWRMKERRVGVFCADLSTTTDKYANWVCPTHEHNSNQDLHDDINVTLWNDYALRNNRGKVMTPKSICLGSLYPSCDIVSNRAVQTAVPLTKLTSRHSPVEVVYG